MVCGGEREQRPGLSAAGHSAATIRFRSVVAALVLASALGCNGKAPDTATPSPVGAPGVEGQVDLGTDEAVRSEYKKATGKQLGEDHGCIGRTDVKGVIVLGDFAHDMGCRPHSAFVAGRFMTWDTLFKEGLGHVGWASTSADERLTLARSWMERVIFHWGGSFVTETNQSFDFDDTPAFTPPTAKAEGDVVTVVGWIGLPAGMIHQDAYEQVTLTIAADGAVTVTRSNAFVVPGERLQ